MQCRTIVFSAFLLACNGSRVDVEQDAGPTDEDAGDHAGDDAGNTHDDGGQAEEQAWYHCEVPGGQSLVRELWDPNDSPLQPRTIRYRSGTEDFPFQVGGTMSGYSLFNLPDDTHAFFWGETPPGSFDREFFYALLDADDAVLVGPRRLESLSDFVWFRELAVSEQGQLALYYWMDEGRPGVSDRLLLMEQDGTLIVETEDLGVTGLYALTSTKDGDFVMLAQRALGGQPPQSALTFSRLDATSAFTEQSEVIAEPFLVTPSTTSALIPLDDGYLVAWDEFVGASPRLFRPNAARIGFRRIDLEGRPVGEELDLLPTPEAPVQSQLTWVYFGDALGLLWVEDDQLYEDPADPDGTWPHLDERIRFMLLSRRDLTPRSDAISIPKSERVGDPRLFIRDGNLGALAHVGHVVSDNAVLQPTSPIEIDCTADTVPDQ